MLEFLVCEQLAALCSCGESSYNLNCISLSQATGKQNAGLHKTSQQEAPDQSVPQKRKCDVPEKCGGKHVLLLCFCSQHHQTKFCCFLFALSDSFKRNLGTEKLSSASYFHYGAERCPMCDCDAQGCQLSCHATDL